MAEIEIPEDPNELKLWIELQEAEKAEDEDKIKELSEEENREREAEQKLMAQLNEILRRRREAQRKKDELRHKDRMRQTALAQAKRKLATFMSEQAILKRLEDQWHEFDNITATHKWREFAFPHQLDGAKRLASAKRAILGDKRGLGKSLTSLIWADMVGAKRVLIFAPKDVLQNFKREIEYWAPHRNVTSIGGMSKVQRDLILTVLNNAEQWTVLCNYEAWRRDPELLEYFKSLKADTVIIDEAHNIKDKKTSAFKGIREVVYAENQCNLCGGEPERYSKDSVIGGKYYRVRCTKCLHEPENFGDFCSVKNVLPMTGTAILNRPQDLWTLLNLVDRQLFPSEDRFLYDYCAVDLYTRRWKFRPGGEQALIKKLGMRFVKRSKEDLPEGTFKQQTIERHYLEFDPKMYPDQWKIMEQIRKYGAIKMTNAERLDIIGILPEILRRRQAITWPAGIVIWEYDDEGKKTGRVLYRAPAAESIKMDKCMEIAKEVIFEDEDRLVIFSQFKEALKELERRFKELKVPVVRYDGDISDSLANEAQLDFQAKTAANHPAGTSCNSSCLNWGKPCDGYKWQVILCHYKKGGVGLNLNAARQVILLDREWNPGKEDQAQGRVDRIDNIHDSVIHTIHVSGTIDNFMDELIEQKAQMIDGFEETHEMLEKMRDALMDEGLM